MQPDELEFRVGQDVGRQRATGVVGCIDDDSLSPVSAVAENGYLPAGADDKPCRPGVDGAADWRHCPA